ncbi:histidine kinase [Cellulophaga baltica]|uniref:sensor histidine kinase n=1 Tax=Cellulophaga TaxID=104264 RepID=UPI001C07425A|nr:MULTISPECIES: histidine kinase [Cellulophaga]MBU2997120.1 histidine kinase [Cellulophaga baltica]MDO6768518.1 histidine kinase [Cellulophaga sp. 1_MG-2023]
MELKKTYKELLFWVLQFVAWTMIGAVGFVIPELSPTYKWFSFILSVAISIGITSAYRFYLKRNIDINNFTKTSFVKLMLAFIFCVVLFYQASVLADKIYDLFYTKTEEEIAWIKANVSFVQNFISCTITILIWTCIYLGVKFILAVNKNRAESLALSATLKEAQLNTLKGQVNPHFMFNSLNNIRGLMLEDVDKSREMITKLSDMLQYALSKNTVDLIVLQEEIEMVDNYIALAKIQMEDRLVYEKKIAAETLSISIPPMIIQLLVENAAKHGISNLKNGGTIVLETLFNNNELQVIVTNTGKLSISKNSTKLGLKNIRQRLRLVYGPKASFSLEEINEEVVATIKIPMA